MYIIRSTHKYDLFSGLFRFILKLDISSIFSRQNFIFMVVFSFFLSVTFSMFSGTASRILIDLTSF